VLRASWSLITALGYADFEQRKRGKRDRFLNGSDRQWEAIAKLNDKSGTVREAAVKAFQESTDLNFLSSMIETNSKLALD
jgi:hypothetical protein